MARVVITGGNRGLGLALVQTYAARGDDVVAGVRSPGSADSARAAGASIHEFDATNNDSVCAFADAVALGGGVDLLINNAGVDARAFGAGERERSVMQLSAEHVEAEMQVNAIAPMMLIRSLAPSLGAGSKVLNISSQIGSMEVSQKMGSDVGYAISKAALNMVTIKFAVALRDQGVIVVAMHPGWVQTDMGGAAATDTIEAVVPKIVATTDRLTAADSGSFVRNDGTVHPW